MGMLRVLSRRGDDRVEWDAGLVATGDPEAAMAVREAERIFAAERAKGATAFKVEKAHGATRLDQFDPAVEQIVLVPRVVVG